MKLNKLRLLQWLNKKQLTKHRKKLLRKKLLKKNKLLNKNWLLKKLKLRNSRDKNKKKRKLRNKKLLKKRKRRLKCLNSLKSKNLKLRKLKRKKNMTHWMKKWQENLINSVLLWTKSTLMQPCRLEMRLSKLDLMTLQSGYTLVTFTRSHSPSLRLHTMILLLSNLKLSLLLNKTWTMIQLMRISMITLWRLLMT